ncbi:MAG: AsmA family protein, partial [Bacteroidales bacterium]|nr:AsmA family protein [Bacteroidales bacterium]
MKKALSIIAQVLAYTISLLVLAFVVVLALLLHPKSLQSLVQTQADNYLNCTYEIGNIDLNLFRDFPQLEIEIKEFYLLNPFEGSSNDTLLGLEQMKASLHLGKLLFRQELVIDSFLIDRLNLNAYIDNNGQSNYDILNLETDPNDTSSLSLAFKSIQLG